MSKHPNVQSVYLPDWMLRELRAERARLERNNAWLVQRAWEIAKGAIRALPATPREPSAPSSEDPSLEYGP